MWLGGSRPSVLVTYEETPSIRNYAKTVASYLRSVGFSAYLLHFDPLFLKPMCDALVACSTLPSLGWHFLNAWLSPRRVAYVPFEGVPNRERVLPLSRYYRIVVPSRHVKRCFERAGISADYMYHAIPPAVPLSPRFLREVEEVKGGRLMLLTIASPVPRKGLPALAEAAERLAGRRDVLFYVLTHKRPETGPLTRRLNENVERLEAARDAGAPIHIDYRYGALSDAEKYSLVAACDVYVHPSYAEGFGIPVLEALLFGKPVVACDAPPTNELVSDREAFLFKPTGTRSIPCLWGSGEYIYFDYDPAELAEAVACAADDREGRASKSAAAKERAKDFLPEKVYSRLPELLGLPLPKEQTLSTRTPSW